MRKNAFHIFLVLVAVFLLNPLKSNAKTDVVSSTPPKKLIALTFDDGPYGPSTQAILKILEQEKVPATFFLVGKNVQKYPEEVQQEVANGNVIGNHSYSHSKKMATMSAAELRADVSLNEKLITNDVHISPDLFRAPYGSTSSAMFTELHAEGYKVVGWTLDPRDWDNKNSSKKIIATVLHKIKPGAIILLHDGHETGISYSRTNTINALPTIIASLKKEGYQFVTVDTLINTKAYF